MKTNHHRAAAAVLSIIALGAAVPPVALAAGSFVGMDYPPGNYSQSWAEGVSPDGSVVVGQVNAKEAFRWTQSGGMVGLGDLAGGGFSSAARGVSADGSVVVGTGQSANGYEAFRWTESGGMVGLGDLVGGDFYSSVTGVNADGSVIVGLSYSANGYEAFRWTQSGGMVGLGDLGYDSSAGGVSADGSVVVGAALTPFGYEYEAIRWTQSGGMQRITDWLTAAGVSVPAGWILRNATGISADGSVIVGIGVYDGQERAWRAEVTAVPVPAAAWLFGSGLFGLIGVARREMRPV